MAVARAYANGLAARIAAVLPAAARSVPGLRQRVEAAGLQAEDLTDVDGLDGLPVLGKDELLERQEADPPFGGFLAPGAAVRRVFQSPGPLYEPEPDQPDAWRWAPALAAAGFRPDDVVLNAFGYHLSPAGAMFESACLALGATVLPGGVGNVALQARACADLAVTAYVGLPSYLKRLLEEAEEAGVALSLRRAFVSAEPLPPSLRAWLDARVETVRQGYGTAEAGNLGWECSALDGLHVPDDALVQVCDLSTGAARYDGGDGEVVVTVLSPHYPMVRFGTGDLSAWMTDPCPCGAPTPRLRGWLGRVGDAVKVRGMFLHPRQVSAVMDRVSDVDRYRFVVDRVDHRDILRCEIITAGPADPAAVAAAVRERVRSGLRFDVDVQPVAALTGGNKPIEDIRTWD